MTLTDDEWVAQVEAATANARARNAAFLEAVKDIQVPAVHEAVSARFDSDANLVEVDIDPSALEDYTNTELEQIITDVLRNTHQAVLAQTMQLFETYMTPNSPHFNRSVPFVEPPS